ncbi:williams Beuren syndrome chromosome region 22 protein-like protein [Geopyxis carbonaria]|nr:williams Beuren syndrome chromosome region 22 protein-like protein [Geopyxis carbonaria]
MSRPEDILPPDLFYNENEARKYTTSSRIQSIQSSMTQRCLELLDLPGPSFLLDIGCGSGLSGEILDEEGHYWVGMDISASMLAVALDRETEGDLLLADMGQGVPFRPGTFDAAVSVSAVQWLCNAESSDVSPAGRLSRFFDGLYASIKRGGKAVLQFYPKNDLQRQMITSSAVRAGFGAGLLEDDPDTKNKKVYLVLTVGSGGELSGRDITDSVRNMEGVEVVDDRRKSNTGAKKGETTKDWIRKKKDRDRKKGKIVKSDSKYTGRKRRINF